jgi:SAM-dependent methyltransferase
MKWAAKIAAKIVLSRLPVPYGFWRSIGLFRHGRMDRSEYALKIFRLHTSRAYPAGLPKGATVLELGPGDSVASAIIAAAHGASRVWLVDAGDFATKDVASYQQLASDLGRMGLSAPDLSGATTFADVLTACNAAYLTGGLRSFADIPDASLDLAWSHSVLEHVRKHQLPQTLRELHRVMKPGALASHNVDYQDHLAGALNNLRLPERLWESGLFVDAGFYTNRVPAVVMHQMFRQAGFTLVEENFGRWPALPTPRSALAAEFSAYEDRDLLQRTSHALLRA